MRQNFHSTIDGRRVSSMQWNNILPKRDNLMYNIMMNTARKEEAQWT